MNDNIDEDLIIDHDDYLRLQQMTEKDRELEIFKRVERRDHEKEL